METHRPETQPGLMGCTPTITYSGRPPPWRLPKPEMALKIWRCTGDPVSALEQHEPTGTVRREPVHGALAVRIAGGYRVMFPENDRVMSDPDVRGAQNLDVRAWPIIWCPDAGYHEQDNIRRAQGKEPYQP
jgi:hypothetical protein